MASKKNTVVPIYVDAQDICLRSFSKARYQHLSNSQRDQELRAGSIEVLDLAQRIYRQTARSFGRPFFYVSSSAVSCSQDIPHSIRQHIASEISAAHVHELTRAEINEMLAGMHVASIPTSA